MNTPTSSVAEDPSESLGEAVVTEIARRGQRGAYFDYAGYQKLKTLESTEDLQTFLDRRGFASVRAKDDAAWVADGLEEAMEDRSPPTAIASLDLLSPLLYLIWLLGRLRKKRRVFPSQQKRMASRRRASSPRN